MSPFELDCVFFSQVEGSLLKNYTNAGYGKKTQAKCPEKIAISVKECSSLSTSEPNWIFHRWGTDFLKTQEIEKNTRKMWGKMALSVDMLSSLSPFEPD